MANPEHVAFVKHGTESLNQWRIKNPNVKLDLSGADLSDVDLSFADLNFADLRHVDFSASILRDVTFIGADLRFTYLGTADLHAADLHAADVSFADFRYVNLKDADMRRSVLLAVSLANSENLTMEQLSGDHQPYLCNVILPSNISTIDPNRDCDRLPQLLSDRYGYALEDAQRIVEDAKSKTLDSI
ncbi:MAG: pentapeptide repeat-containing protein [Cyanobacteria bacterium P01_F01_bin.150]